MIFFMNVLLSFNAQFDLSFMVHTLVTWTYAILFKVKLVKHTSFLHDISCLDAFLIVILFSTRELQLVR